MAKLSEKEKLQWKERVRLYEQTNQTGSIASWCRSQQISYDPFLYWKNKLSSKSSPAINRSSFTELSDSTTNTGITLEYHSIQIHLTHNFDPVTLAECLKVLKGALC